MDTIETISKKLESGEIMFPDSNEISIFYLDEIWYLTPIFDVLKIKYMASLSGPKVNTNP